MVGSYSTADNAADPYRQMNAAACRAVDDCWFGGIGSRDPTGTRVGAFHLHWDGAALRTVYNGASARGVSDIEAVGAGYVESVVVGPRRGVAEAPDPSPLELKPRLLHRIAGGAFANDPFVPAVEADGGSELLALDADAAGYTWAVGGGAASGTAVAERGVDGVIARPPLAAVAAGAGPFRELALRGATFGSADRFEDVAAVPATASAWAALVPYADRGRTNAKAHVARIDAASGAVEVSSLPAAGSGRGSAARVAFTSRDRRLDGHQRGLALPLLRRDPLGAGHRPGVRRADHHAPERGGRAVRARHRRRSTTRSCSRRRRWRSRPRPPRRRSPSSWQR